MNIGQSRSTKSLRAQVKEARANGGNGSVNKGPRHKFLQDLYHAIRNRKIKLINWELDGVGPSVDAHGEEDWSHPIAYTEEMLNEQCARLDAYYASIKNSKDPNVCPQKSNVKRSTGAQTKIAQATMPSASDIFKQTLSAVREDLQSDLLGDEDAEMAALEAELAEEVGEGVE